MNELLENFSRYGVVILPGEAFHVWKLCGVFRGQSKFARSGSHPKGAIINLQRKSIILDFPKNRGHSMCGNESFPR